MIITTFKFKDGTTKRYEGTDRIHGLRHQGERPKQVVISTSEGYTIPEQEKDRVNAYIFRDVIPTLAPQHREIGVSPTIANNLPYVIEDMYINFKG